MLTNQGTVCKSSMQFMPLIIWRNDETHEGERDNSDTDLYSSESSLNGTSENHIN